MKTPLRSFNPSELPSHQGLGPWHLVVTLIVLLATPFLSTATHYSGGEISYVCLGNDQYEVTFIVYRDCEGVPLDPTQDIQIASPCDTIDITMNTPAPVELSQLCDLELPNSTCSGGTLPGIEQYTFTTTVTLPPCDTWTFSTALNNRNGAIVNLDDPSNQQMYLETTLNNTVDPCNNSPVFTNIASPYVCLNYPVSYSYGVFDPDADSLTYQLIAARTTNAVPLLYVVPHSAGQPIPGITLDPQTGLLNFTPTTAGNWVVVVQVNEYDAQGNLIGTVLRDMQFIAYPCSNIPPDATTGTITNLSGDATLVGPNQIQVCESGSFCFDMVISDVNPGNVLDAVSNIQQNLPGASFGFSGTNPITCTVCWTASAGTAGFFPFIVNVDDGACPIPGFQTYVYSVEVLEGLFTNVQSTDETCAGAGDGTASVSVTAGTGPFTYLWDTGDTTANITAGAGTYTLTVTDANGCVNTPLFATINATAQPNVADAGPDAVGCMSQLPVNLQGSVTNATGGTWSGGSGQFAGPWSNATYMPGSTDITNGGVDLILTTAGNNGCPPDADTVHLALPNSFAGATVSVTDASCHNVNDGSATFNSNNSGLFYLWDDPAAQTTATATGLGPGTYTVLVSDGLGCDTTASVTINAPAAIAITNLQVIDEGCAGDGDGSVTMTVTGGTPPYSYSWSNLDTTASITVGAGTYTVSITDANNCSSVQATATVNAQAQPAQANAGADMIGCMGDPAIMLQGSVTNATGGTWSGGTGQFSGLWPNVSYSPSISDVINGNVELYLTTTGSAPCAAAQDTLHITLSNAFLNANVTSTPVLCNGQQTATAQFSPQSPGLTYSWNDPSSQSTALANGLGAGNYQLLVSDGLGCDSTFQVQITEPPLLQVSLQGTPPLCNGQSNGSATATVTGGNPGYQYQWSSNANGQITPTAGGLGQGTYILTATDANSCIVQETVTINEPPAIMLSANVPDTVCVNEPITLTAQASGGTGNLSIAWQNIGTGSPILHSFANDQTVVVTASDGNGCAGPVLNFPVHVLDLSGFDLITSGDTTVCMGHTATVSASVPGYPGALTYTWPTTGMSGPGPFQMAVVQDQAVPVEVMDQCGQQLTASILLQVDDPPDVILPGIIAEGCAPLTVDLPDDIVTGTFTYLWDLGDGSTSSDPAPQHTYDAGTYNVNLTVTTPVGCTSSSALPGQVVVHAAPTAAFTASTWTTNMDDPSIDLTNTSTGNLSGYQWDFGDGGVSYTQHASHTYLAPGIFPVQLWIQDANGCVDSIIHSIEITPIHDIVIPTAFTPGANGNGGAYDPTDLSNDVFYPFVEYVDEFLMRIYNRWGELVFESEDIAIGWDGYYRGEMSQQDVYVYQMWLKFVDGTEVEKRGDITLLR